MLAVIHPQQTRRIADSQDEYIGISVHDSPNEQYNCNQMETIWEPTPRELAILNEGGVVVLQILGGIHPPVILGAATIQRD